MNSGFLRFVIIDRNPLKHTLYIVIICAALMVSCSTEKNTWTSKAYHNTTAHFNGYWYANEEIRKIEKTISDAQVDDYNGILYLFPTFDSAMAKGYDKEIQEAIKMASLAIQRHSNSKWVDDAYILVGKARHYSMDWGNAIQTFKHVNSKSKDKDARHLAIINLVRTYVEHKEYNNAQAAIDFLNKAKLSKLNQKKFFLEKAYYYQQLKDYDNMVRNLASSDPLLKKSDRKGRIYFILGQVYQELGFEAEAYNYYKKCLGTNPEYEVDFYARLYMAQVTEISRSRDINVARKSFRKLLKDSKNKEFHDKIYYEMGVFELKQKNLPEAIANFNESVRRGKNQKIDGEAYLRLGEIYYDTLKNYKLSQAYYDSAIRSLPPEYENYAAIKTRAEVLNEFVKHLNTIEWQDSLLMLANLDTATIRAQVAEIVRAKQRDEEKRARAAKKRPNRVDISGNDNSSIFGNGDDSGTGTDAVDWYFGNPSAMALGQTEFVRVWGNVKLEDNWRRSQRETRAASVVQQPVLNDSISVAQNGDPQNRKPAADPIAEAYNELVKQIPITPEQEKAALDKIEEAYFHLGDIYYFKLKENDNATETYKVMLKRFPDSKYEPEVLYTLYLIHKDSAQAEAEQYATLLKTKHPESTFAKILINPEYLHESGLAVEKQKALYKKAYEDFQARNYIGANFALEEADALGQTSFTPTLKLLPVLITAQTEDISKYQFQLETYIKTYESDPLAAYAKKLLEASRQFQKDQEKRKGIQYVPSFDEPHYFVIVYKRADKLDGVVSGALETFNQKVFPGQGLKTTNLILNDDYGITFVADLNGKNAAIDYFKSFIENRPTMTGLRTYNLSNFVITKDNFDIFYRTKGLDEYIQFFEKNYRIENQ